MNLSMLFATLCPNIFHDFSLLFFAASYQEEEALDLFGVKH